MKRRILALLMAARNTVSGCEVWYVWKFWTARGYFGDGAKWLQEALAKGGAEAPPAVRAGDASYIQP